MHSSILLTHLESCPEARAWAVYIRRQAKRVQDHIHALREFADLKPGRVADICNGKADVLEARVTRLLDSLQEKLCVTQM